MTTEILINSRSYEVRIALVENEINIDIIMYAFGLFCIAIAIAQHLRDKDSAVCKKIHDEIRASGYDIVVLRTIYALASSMFIYWVYNGSIYYRPLLIYSNDIEFNLSTVAFWSGLQINYALIVTIFLDNTN